MNHLYLFPLTLVLLVFQTTQALSQPNSIQSPIPASSVSQHQPGYLGVNLLPIPRAVTAQLASLISAGQGLLVGYVESHSPAALSGIQIHDILLKFEDQKLYSPAQLASLVRATHPDTQVTLQLVRQAQLKTVNVKITARQLPRLQRPPSSFRQPFHRVPRFNPRLNTPPAPSSGWESFETLEVHTLGNGRYHAEVTFKDNNNEKKSFSFEGKKDEIIQQIQQQTGLPFDKKQALLNTLNKPEKTSPSPFNTPFFQGTPFNDPFFQDNFFHHPFFNGFPAPQRRPYFDH